MAILLTRSRCSFLLPSLSPKTTILFSATSQAEQTMRVLSTVRCTLPPHPNWTTLATHKQLFPCNYAQAAIQMAYYPFTSFFFHPMLTKNVSICQLTIVWLLGFCWPCTDHRYHRGNYFRDDKREIFYLWQRLVQIVFRQAQSLYGEGDPS